MRGCSTAPVRPEHAPALAAIHKDCFPGAEWDTAALLQVLAMPGAFGHLALDGATAPVGFSLAFAAGGGCDVATLCVLPAARGRGFGSCLVAALVEEARRRGAAEVFLEVGERNEAARALYGRAGFVEVGRRAGYYRGGEAALTLKRSLA